MGKDAVQQHDEMGDDKDDKNRRHDHNGFLDAANVQYNQHHAQKAGNSDLVMVKAQRQITEKRIHAGGNGNGDGQHIVHQKGAAGDDAGLFTQHVGGDDIPAAAMGKMLDDPGIRVGDDENRKGRCQTPEEWPDTYGSPARGRLLPDRRKKKKARRRPARSRPGPESATFCEKYWGLLPAWAPR